MSFKPEVITDGRTFSGNALRFATEEEAQAYVFDLMCRWVLARAARVVESEDPVNYRWVDGRAEAIEKTDD